MRPQLLALTAAAASAAIMVATFPVEAQERARTRITVQPRSYLDAGTTVKPGEANYHRYAFPLESQYPSYGPDRPGSGTWESSRWPLLRIFETPNF